MLILHSCTERCKPSIIDHGKFDGYAVAFYHKPVSGSGCEIKFIPTCRNELTTKNSPTEVDYAGMSSSEGVSVVVSLNDLRFKNIFENSKKIKVVNHDSLAQEFRYVYVCPVELRFSGVENNTPTNRENKDFFEEKLVLQNGNTVHFKYFYSNQIEIQSLKVTNSGD
jgi:hypothetical protein